MISESLLYNLSYSLNPSINGNASVIKANSPQKQIIRFRFQGIQIPCTRCVYHTGHLKRLMNE